MDRETMLADIWALMQGRMSEADRAAIWTRYGDEIKARIATKAEANGWRRDGKGWVK
jgi:hypothetical protein